MDEMRFRIVGVTRENTQRWQDQAHTRAGSGRAGVGAPRGWKALKSSTRWWIGIGAGFVVAYYAAAGTATEDVRGRRILLLLDESGSMGDTAERTNRQLATLKANNISITDPVPTNGYAISAQHTEYSVLQPLQAALENNPRVDTVYFISDFKGGDNDDNDAEGYAELRALAGSHHLTVYFCTVDQSPPLPEYYQIPRESGGGVIDEFRKTN